MSHFLDNIPEDEYKRKKKRKTIILFSAIGAAVVVGIAVIVVFSYFYMNRSFSGYDVVREMARTDSNNVQYISFNDNLLKYSRDGISALNESGETLWNGGYEMEQPEVDVCGEYAEVADIGAKKFYVYDGKSQGVDIETALPIGRAKVSSNGKVAVLLHDEDSDVINIYNPYSAADSLEVEIPTNVTDDGYPLDFDISPDGNSLVIAYLRIENGAMENKVCFYNFTDVGQDQNTLVGGKSYETKMISNIQFVADDEVAIFYENGFTLFKDMKKPEEVFDKSFDSEIKSAEAGEDNIMIVTGTAGDTKNQKLFLYSFGGKEELSENIPYKYSKLYMTDGEIIFTDDQTCNILRENGKEKFAFDFGKKYDYFLPSKKDNQYFYIDETSIQLIKISG